MWSDQISCWTFSRGMFHFCLIQGSSCSTVWGFVWWKVWTAGQFSTWPLLLQAMLLNASWLDGPAPFEWRMWSPYFPIQFIFQFDWAQNSFPLCTEKCSSSFFVGFFTPTSCLPFWDLLDPLNSVNFIYFLSCSLNKIWVYVICWFCFYIHFTQHHSSWDEFFAVGLIHCAALLSTWQAESRILAGVLQCSSMYLLSVFSSVLLFTATVHTLYSGSVTKTFLIQSLRHSLSPPSVLHL